MDETLLKDVGKYMYPFIGNTGYDDSYYFDALVKKYGKKTVLETSCFCSAAMILSMPGSVLSMTVYVQNTVSNGRTVTFFGSCWYAFHSVSFCCIFIQLSADVFVALLILKAISGLNAAFPLTNSDNAFLLTPSIRAVSVTVNPSGFITSSRNTVPGCVGFLLIIYFTFL
jgi:hypothetical protein